MSLLEPLQRNLTKILPVHPFGKVTGILGLLIEVGGLQNNLKIGDACTIHTINGTQSLLCEVVGFRSKRALLMPFGNLEGVGLGNRVEISDSVGSISPTDAWLGRVVNAFAQPIDGKENLIQGPVPYLIHPTPIPAHKRKRVGARLDLGVRALNTFVTCCQGQRMGIFAGSGIGKSVLMSMISRYTKSDVIVIGLIGERGREVQDFLTQHLGPEGLARSVVVVATSDEPALTRKRAAFMTLTIAEYFRDQGKQVLCLMDSVTRFAMAQREIGLSIGEPPASKGYTPTVFAELPKLLERAGPGTGDGKITGLFTVLVEGDDHNEPIADAVRGILDGHIVLDRKIAERGRFPAINILRSVSRMMPDCNLAGEQELIKKARALISTYEDMSEMIQLGAYRKGSDPQVDEALFYYPILDTFLNQGVSEHASFTDGFTDLAQILSVKAT
jgi:flagellum-specific ATP synthase